MGRIIITKLAALLLAACALQAQTYTYTFRQTKQADGAILTEPWEGEGQPPVILSTELITTWADSCPPQATESFHQIQIIWTNGVASFAEEDLTPGGRTLTIEITPLAPPAGFATTGILVEADGSTGTPLIFAASTDEGLPDPDGIAAKAAAWLAKTWTPGSCRNVRMRWLAAKRYPRTDMTPTEWHVAAASWPVTARLIVGP